MCVLTVEEAARRLGVSEKTVRNMIDRGSLPGAYKLDPRVERSPYRIPLGAVEALELARGGNVHNGAGEE
jgi:excisionase family DNA binding protein